MRVRKGVRENVRVCVCGREIECVYVSVHFYNVHLSSCAKVHERDSLE